MAGKAGFIFSDILRRPGSDNLPTTSTPFRPIPHPPNHPLGPIPHPPNPPPGPIPHPPTPPIVPLTHPNTPLPLGRSLTLFQRAPPWKHPTGSASPRATNAKATRAPPSRRRTPLCAKTTTSFRCAPFARLEMLARAFFQAPQPDRRAHGVSGAPRWPAWKCVQRVEGISHRGTPTTRLQGAGRRDEDEFLLPDIGQVRWALIPPLPLGRSLTHQPTFPPGPPPEPPPWPPSGLSLTHLTTPCLLLPLRSASPPP